MTTEFRMTNCTCGPWWSVTPPPPCPMHAGLYMRCPSCGGFGAHFCPGPPRPNAPAYYGALKCSACGVSIGNSGHICSSSGRVFVSRDTNTATG